MSDARWFEIERAARSAARHFGNATRQHATALRIAAEEEEEARYDIEMALMHSMQAGHTSLEKTVTLIMEAFHEELPVGRDWHADLLTRAAAKVGRRPEILDSVLFAAAMETRKFRHRAMHTYDDFDTERAGTAVAAASILAVRLPDAIAAFRQATDP